MRIFRELRDLSDAPRGASLVLGSFDGVHRGHAALIAAARARRNPVGVVTFTPHPRLLTQPRQAPLSSDARRTEIFRSTRAGCGLLCRTAVYARICIYLG